MSGLSAFFKNDKPVQPSVKSNNNNRAQLNLASDSIGGKSDGGDFSEIDPTTAHIVLEGLFITAVKEWCEENKEELLGILVAADVFAETSMSVEEKPQKKKPKNKM